MKEIIFKLNDGRKILLTNVVETFGHDDSLPFNAILMADLKGTGHFTKLAKAWNDGWGGMTNIDAIGNVEREICEELDKFIRNNYEFRYCYDGQEQAMSESLESMVSNLACLAIDNNLSELTSKVMEQLKIFVKMKELEVGDIVDSPKDIVKVAGIWEEYKRGNDKPVAKRMVTEGRRDIIDCNSGMDVTHEMYVLKKSLVDTYQWKLVFKF